MQIIIQTSSKVIQKLEGDNDCLEGAVDAGIIGRAQIQIKIIHNKC